MKGDVMLSARTWLVVAMAMSCSRATTTSAAAGGGATHADKPAAYWVERMRVDVPAARKEAGDALRERSAENVPLLIEMLKSRGDAAKERWNEWFGADVFMRAFMLHGYAASALGELGPAASAAIPELLAACAESDANVSAQYASFVAVRARAALIKIRGATLDDLEAQLAERRSSAWQDAVATAAELGEYGRPLTKVLVAALTDTSCARRDRAANALARIHADSSVAVPALAAACSNSDAGLRFFALRSITSYGTAALSARAAVIARLADALPSNRQIAITTLVAITPRVQRDSLVPLLAPLHVDPFTEVRATADAALKELEKRVK